MVAALSTMEPAFPDKHGMSFVPSDAPISFIVARKPEKGRQLPEREGGGVKKKDLTGPAKE